MKGIKKAMQNKCPNCGWEIYAPAVWSFSHGEEICLKCGEKSEIMDVSEYIKKLRELKNSNK